uniref:HP domain-containing protein n=1 Tax=Macrostomum lignano TaxID=282301 RepID=A0A1I8GRS5_9PLAT
LKFQPVTLEDVASLFLKDGDDNKSSTMETAVTTTDGQEDSEMEEAARVRLRGKAAEGIQRWSTMQQPVAKDSSPPTSVAKELPTRGRPITELVSQLQQQAGEQDTRSKKGSPWASSIGKRLNFREQTRPHSRSLDESGETSSGDEQSVAASQQTKPSADQSSAQQAAEEAVRTSPAKHQYKLRSSTAPLPGASGSLADRLQALQKSGEENWKQRVSPRSSPDRPRSQIADLQSQLIREEAVGWRSKQPASSSDEASSFTVRSRLGDLANSEAAERLSGLLSSPARGQLPRRTLTCSPPPGAAAAAAAAESDGVAGGRPDSLSFDSDETAGSGFAFASIYMSETAEQFFPSMEPEDLTPADAVKPKDEDENEKTQQSALRRRPMPQNRRRAQKNPVRARAQLEQSAASPSGSPASSVAQWDSSATSPPAASAPKTEDKARPSSKVNQGLAKEAIQGLQAKVDLDAVSLQRADPAAPVGPFGAISQAHKSLMLVQIKGRRQAQARLVRPRHQSLCSGDCYLLVSRDAVYLWQGELSNVLEASKASELAKWVAAKRALGYAGSSSEPLQLSSSDVSSSKSARFWRLLGYESPQEVRPPLADEEDSVYEQLLADTNAYYRVDTAACSLVPIEEFWGRPATHRLLELPDTDAVVCDFGSEVYLWCSRRADRYTRRLGVKLAELLFNSPYDYSSCLVSPLEPWLALTGRAITDGDEEASVRGERRPDWCLLGKVNENGETVLFREKFTDWPDKRGLILGQRPGRLDASNRPLSQSLAPPDWDLIPCQPADMLAAWQRRPPACLELEGSRLGRGGTWTEVTDGLKRSFQLETLSVRAWLVTPELERRELPAESAGQLNTCGIRLLRWQYRLISLTGRLGGVGSGPGGRDTGRDRCAYFYWQGAGAGQREKGAGALLTVQLDEERCPQVHVAEGSEPPAFARIFQGSCIIYSESSSADRSSVGRLFLVRGHRLEECLLVEVPRSPDSLRPRGCYLLLLPDGRGHLWLGSATASWYRELARQRAEKFAAGTPMEMGFEGRPVPPDSWATERPGGESGAFLAALGGPGAQLDIQQDEDDEVKDKDDPPPVRVYKFASSARSSGGGGGGGGGGDLQFSLVSDPWHEPDRPSPFPCQLSALLALPQPANAFVLFDAGSRLFLWQGWNPSEATAATAAAASAADAEAQAAAAAISSRVAGSSLTRFEAEKRAVLSTAINYGKMLGIPANHQLLVFAGSEPLAFRHLFPSWEPDLGTGAPRHPAQELQLVHERLNNLSFTLERLQQRPLPEGVDPGRLEVYLDDAEFASAFSMTRHEFAGLNDWRRLEMKKALGLY